MMRQRNLSRPRRAPAADQRLRRRGMMRLPHGPIISINVHGSTLCNTPRFAEGLVEGALAHGIDPGRLMIEIL